jgi:hypothetical protein
LSPTKSGDHITGVIKNPIVINEFIMGGKSLYLADIIPRSRVSQPRFTVTKNIPGMSNKDSREIGFMNTRNTIGIKTMLCAKVKRFLKRVLST